MFKRVFKDATYHFFGFDDPFKDLKELNRNPRPGY
jgi:hypothetical protein